MPVDVIPDPSGNVIPSWEDESYRITVAGDPNHEKHTSHFQTCPNANQWRK